MFKLKRCKAAWFLFLHLTRFRSFSSIPHFHIIPLLIAIDSVAHQQYVLLYFAEAAVYQCHPSPNVRMNTINFLHPPNHFENTTHWIGAWSWCVASAHKTCSNTHSHSMHFAKRFISRKNDVQLLLYSGILVSVLFCILFLFSIPFYSLEEKEKEEKATKVKKKKHHIFQDQDQDHTIFCFVSWQTHIQTHTQYEHVQCGFECQCMRMCWVLYSLVSIHLCITF